MNKDAASARLAWHTVEAKEKQERKVFAANMNSYFKDQDEIRRLKAEITSLRGRLAGKPPGCYPGIGGSSPSPADPDEKYENLPE